MSITSTNYTDVAYILEPVTNGVTPDTPTFQSLPTKGSSLQGNTSTIVSEVIRKDRQIDDLIIVDQDVSGAVDYELSYEPYKPLITSLLQTAALTLAPVTGTDIGFTGTTNVIDTGATDVSGLLAGQYIIVSGATDPANNGTFQLSSNSTSNTITLTSTAGLVTEVAGASVTIAANTLRNGVADPDSYTFVKTITGIATPVYMYYRGCQLSSMSLDFATASILGGSINVIGLNEDVTETGIAGQDFDDVPNYTLMNSVSSLAIESTGLAAGTIFQNVNLTIDNNINAAKAIGTLGAADLASFTLNVTADITIYFQDKDAYDKYLNATSFSLELKATDGDGNIIIVSMPYCKFESLQSPIPGKDAFFTLNGSLRALRDPINDYTVQIDLLDAPV